jgi:Malonyl-CoA decarboxylase C-terminal domain
MINSNIMLHLITTLTDQLLQYIKDDPVRPDIPGEFRVDRNRFVAALVENERPASMVCVSMHDFVPESVQDLDRTVDDPTTAVFYTIWSYKPGSGAELLRTVLPRIREQYPTVTNFVTLSPKTELARKFHLRNGATVFRENSDTVNYCYLA